MEKEMKQQMLELLLAIQEAAAARQEKRIAEMKAAQAEMEARADARQDKADAKIEARFNQFNEEIKVRQAKADAQADAHVERKEAIMRSIPSDIDRILQQQIEAWKERFLSIEGRTTICTVPPVACPDN
jgi:N-methylhydantoinase B/oxoprolinase/acetone carboxylase alpha subunit